MKTCVVLSGAGISADSGLKTFRDDGGLWEGHRVEEVATPQAFARNPQMVLNFYNQRRRQLKEVKPNAAHHALVDLEAHYHVEIITQNVDDLHERAGSQNVLHLHGELNKLRSSVDENNIIDWHTDQQLSDVDANGNPMRPHIVWFGEAVPMMEEAIRRSAQADLLLIIGTSLQVYPAASLMTYIGKNVPIYLIDPNPTSLTNVKTIAETAKNGVPKVVKALIQASQDR